MLHSVGADWEVQGSTMAFGWMGRTATAVAARGVKVEDQLLDLGLGAAEGRVGDATPLSPAEYMLLCVRVINLVDDEMHGTTRARMRRGTAALGVKLLGSGRTLGAAIDQLFRFYAIAGGFCDVQLVRDERVATIQIRADGEPSDLTAVVEEMMATHLHMLFSYYLGFYLPLGGFVSTSSRHPSLGGRHPYLGASVGQGAVTAFAFPASYLDLPSKTQLYDREPVDAVLFWLSCFEPRESQDGAPGHLGDLSSAVFNALIGGDLSFEACCEALGVGPRHFRSTLFAEGTTYRQLRKAALIERVRPYLEAEACADDMAFGLGYSDARSLRRALKGATGMSMSDMRRPRSSWAPRRGDGLIQNLRRELAWMA